MFWKFTRSYMILISLDAIKLSNYCLQSNQFCFDIFFLLPFWGVSQTTYSVIKRLFELSQSASKPNECNSTTEFLKVTLNAALPAVCTSLVSLEGFITVEIWNVSTHQIMLNDTWYHFLSLTPKVPRMINSELKCSNSYFAFLYISSIADGDGIGI